jgi:hypothetical protein
MSRHIIDKPEIRESSHRAAEYIKHDRKQIPSEATKQLQRRPRARADQKRVEEFTRIERQK